MVRPSHRARSGSRHPRAALSGGGHHPYAGSGNGSQRRARRLSSGPIRHSHRGHRRGRKDRRRAPQPRSAGPAATEAALAMLNLFDTLAPNADAVVSGLNPEQLDAVTHGEGPLLIVAGAGTGKTEVLTRRIAWLMTSGRARPDQIL